MRTAKVAKSATKETKGKVPKGRTPKAPAVAEEKKVSALDAAARVLSEKGVAMTCQELIGAMAAKGYWTSPGGKTPHATLYSAILRELATKGDASRFRKAAPGRFAASAVAGDHNPAPAKNSPAKTPAAARKGIDLGRTQQPQSPPDAAGE
jgi:hypothetical protein